MSGNGNGNGGGGPGGGGGQVVQVPRGAAGIVARQSGTGQELEYRGETASTAIAEGARAQVEARFIMARRFPRDLMRVREQLLRACQRPRFAEVAIYHKPVGKGVEGPSIRMAEEAARAMGNIAADVITVYDDQQKRIIQVSATDLEANLTYPMTVTVEKTVERSSPREGQTIRGQRINSQGRVVYVVDASDDEILNKVAALVSKALRTNLLRLLPGDLLEEAMDAAYHTRDQEAASDPTAAVKKMCDAFGSRGVPVEQLAEYLGHSVDKCTLPELAQLRGLYAAIKDGEATWAEAMEHARGQRQPQAPSEPPTAGPPSNLNEAAARAKAARESKPVPASASAPAPASEGKKLKVIMDGDPSPPELDATLIEKGKPK
jgi:hypothetical protein